MSRCGFMFYWLVFHESPVSLIITPDALRLRIGRGPSEHTSEHLQGGIDPVLLVDRGCSFAFNARDEQNHKDALTTTTEEWSPSDSSLRSLPSSATAPVHLDAHRVQRVLPVSHP